MFARILLIVGITLAITGCATNKVMDGFYQSEVAPNYQVLPSQIIVVAASRSGNTLESKYYVDKTVSSLENRGFNNVYSLHEFKKTSLPADIVVFINVSQDTSSYQYQDPMLGLVNTGDATINCTGYGNFATCTKNQETRLGITGYTTRTDYLTGYYFSATWIDTLSKETVMFVLASSFEEGCSKNATYGFLIPQTIKRLNFEKPLQYEYSVRMPETYTCH